MAGFGAGAGYGFGAGGAYDMASVGAYGGGALSGAAGYGVGVGVSGYGVGSGGRQYFVLLLYMAFIILRIVETLGVEKSVFHS